MSSFDLLHRKIQSFIHKQKWESFRPIQDDAINHINSNLGDLLICAPTASGKTEAAFLPIISKIADNFENSYAAIYISPLKALINDQFRRVDEICEDIGMPVTKWHGDISQTTKNKSLLSPRGILLITPESLESMLLNKTELVRRAFSNLQFVVVDEVHSFAGTERGAQLLSILSRIQIEAKCNPVRIALSATIGNPVEVANWISQSGKFNIVQDEDWNDSVGIEGKIKGFTSRYLEDESIEIDPGFYSSIYRDFLSSKNLIFGNSKQKLEQTGYLVNEIAKNHNSNTNFLIHHGSLSKEIRETAENKIKTSKDAISIFCTSTLEMGIDIGSIEKVGLIDPPWSVSGFSQRVGRSGRREGSSKKFEFFILQEELSEDSHLSELLREDLVKAIALVLLYLEKFKEPLDTKKAHYSTMVHQILSLALQKSGVNYAELQEVILEKSFNNIISKTEFNSLVQFLFKSKLLFIDGSGLICPGKVGEKIVEHYEFYSVFQTSDQWNVVCDGAVIGQIPVIGTYSKDDRLLLGGRIWQVVEVVENAKRLVVTPARKGKAPLFTAAFGLTHKRIHEKMREIYISDKQFKFLDQCAQRLLSEGRQTFKNYFSKKHEVIQSNFEFFEGTKIQTTILNTLKILGIDHGASEVVLQIKDLDSDWSNKVLNTLQYLSDEKQLAQLMKRENKIIEKFDLFLNEDALNSAYASSYLDLKGAIAWLNSISHNVGKVE